jgi:hypothetical protein
MKNWIKAMREKKRIDAAMKHLLTPINTLVGVDTKVILVCGDDFDYGMEFSPPTVINEAVKKAIKEKGQDWKIIMTPNYQALGKIIATGQVIGLVIMNVDEMEDESIAMSEPIRHPHGQIAERQITYFVKEYGYKMLPLPFFQNGHVLDLDEKFSEFLAALN